MFQSTKFNVTINAASTEEIDHYVYSKQAAAKILGLRNTDKISHLEIKDDCVEVYIYGALLPIQLLFSEFKFYFASSRKERSHLLKGEKINEFEFLVQSQRDEKVTHKVIICNFAISCSCKDFEKQQELTIPQPCCKHIYKALDILGHNSLSEYLKATQLKLKEEEALERRSHQYNQY